LILFNTINININKAIFLFTKSKNQVKEAFEKCSILVKVKPPACRAYAPEGKARISTTGIY